MRVCLKHPDVVSFFFECSRSTVKLPVCHREVLIFPFNHCLVKYRPSVFVFGFAGQQDGERKQKSDISYKDFHLFMVNMEYCSDYKISNFFILRNMSVLICPSY